MRPESSLPEVPFQGRKIQSSQYGQVHNEAYEKPHRGESSDSIDDVYFEVPPKRLVDHLTERATNRIEHKVNLHQGTRSYKTSNVLECLNELDEHDIADKPILENPRERRREPARDA